ncbi:unnamed protein product [Auanema sp. JU1783]|nr:unnamed protein product [Auanema sp. JU1783]
MAKWGEGDPRWIVEERADATNVNNWHWTEKNATGWSKNRLKELLHELKIEDGPVVVTLGEITKCEGEATANNRKAKLIFLFEWEMKIDFVARISGSEIEYKGNAEIPNLSDENEAHEVDVNFSITTKGPHDAQIRTFLHKFGVPRMQEKLGEYIKELKQEYSKGIILPTDQVKPQIVTKGRTTTVDKKSFQNTVVVEKKEEKSNEIFDVKNVSVQDSFKIPPERLFECLSQPELVRVWANGNVDWDFKEGGNFALFGGNVTGSFNKIETNKLIDVKWRLKSYPSGHYANIKFILADEGDASKLTLQATGVPSHLSDDTENGLQRYYLQSIARTFGFGARIC